MLVARATNPDRIIVTIKTNGTSQLFTGEVDDFDSPINIKAIGNSGVLEVYIDDVLKTNDTITVDQDLTNISSELYFSALDSVSLFKYNSQLSYIKINDNVWTFPEGTGSTTTNSQSVVTTLNSDLSTEAMWVASTVFDRNDSIFKGRIFCTNQDNYSIQNGLYTERSRDIKYTIYE